MQHQTAITSKMIGTLAIYLNISTVGTLAIYLNISTVGTLAIYLNIFTVAKDPGSNKSSIYIDYCRRMDILG